MLEKQRTILVTGASGLIGSEVCLFFGSRGFRINGLDNNQRAIFFGPQGDTRWNRQRLQKTVPAFTHHELDIRNRAGLSELVKDLRPELVVHAAAQPSHDRAAAIPLAAFDTIALAT